MLIDGVRKNLSCRKNYLGAGWGKCFRFNATRLVGAVNFLGPFLLHTHKGHGNPPAKPGDS
jgi:hypothetical protein